MTKISIIYYSATGNTYELAKSIAAGAESVGAEVRVRRVEELAPRSAIEQNAKWLAFDESMSQEPNASLDDLEWADAIAVGSPTRFGLPSAQLKQFLDQTGGLWAKGLLADKVATSFTGASTQHGGLESTALAMNNVFYHWGSIIMPLGYSSKEASTHGNPYGASWVSKKGASPDKVALEAAYAQGKRLAEVTKLLVNNS